MDTHVTNCSTWITKVAGDSMLYTVVLVVKSFSATVLLRGLLALQSAGIVYGVGSVCPTQSVDQSAACSGFAAVGPAGRIYRSIAARPAPQQHGAQLRLLAVPRLQLT